VVNETGETSTSLVKIGELLIGVGALTSGDLTEAVQIAKRMGVPIGRVLVMSGCVTEGDLQQALELQSMIKDRLVDIDTGKKALEMVFKEKLTLQQALKRLNWEPKRDQTSNKLGDLLIDSNIVTPEQLEKALEASFQSGMPLGGTLVLQGVISAQLLPTILHVQDQIRDGKLGRDEAIEHLQTALMFWARADQSKQDDLQTLPGSSTPPPKPSAANAAGTPAAGMPAPPPRPVAAPSAVPPPPPPPAPPPPPPVPAGAQAAANQVSLVELLKLSGVCTQASLDQSIRDALNDSRLASKVLLAIGILDSNTLNTYVHVQALIARGRLRTDQALFLLNNIRQRKITLDEALTELGVPATL
jgi:hypothetical protein